MITEDSMRMSTLPPETTTPTVRPVKRCGWARTAARAAAPAPSATIFSVSSRRVIAASISSSPTSSTSATSASITGRVSPPGCLTAMPSATVGPPKLGREVAQQTIDRGVEHGLDADDLDAGLEVPGRDGTAGDQAAATDRHHQHVKLGRGLEQLEPDRALAGDDGGIVVGVDEGEPLLLLEPAGVSGGVLEPLAVQDHPGTVLARALDLGQRREARHDDRGRNAQALGMVGDTLGVVAGRHGDDAAGALLRREAGELDQGTAGLERAGVLEVLQLEPDPCPGQARQGRRGDAGGHGDRAGDAAAGLLDGGEGDGHGPSFGASMENGRPAGAPGPGGSCIKPSCGPASARTSR